jgi:hypothetical protein
MSVSAVEQVTKRVRMTIIHPLVQEGGPAIELSDAKFAELERVGEIALSAELRQRLDDLAHFWAYQLRGRQSPRPKQFRERLDLIRDTLTKACRALDLNREGASIWEQHLFAWARNSGVEGTPSFYEDTSDLLDRMCRMADLSARLKKAFPRDSGGWRPYDDKRLFIALADVFERAGGEGSITGPNTTPAAWPIHRSAGSCRPSTKYFLFELNAHHRALIRRSKTRCGLVTPAEPKGILLIENHKQDSLIQKGAARS